MQSELEHLNAEIKRNINELMDVYQTFFREDLPFLWVQWGHMSQLMIEVCHRIVQNPDKLIRVIECYQRKAIDLMEYHIHYLNELAEDKNFHSVLGQAQKDNRFAASAWEQQYVYKLIKDFYLLYSDFANDLLNCLGEFAGKIYDQFALYVRNYIDAISPGNFIMTNPEVLQVTAEQGVANLLKGLKLFLQDLNENKGHLNISMTDKYQFKVGENIAKTPGDVIFRNDIMELIQYRPQTTTVHEVPLLIVPPFINKYYILDLTAEKSFVNWAVQQGFSVFIISWINPDESLRHKRFEDYVREGPVQAVDTIIQKYPCTKLNVLGYCVGGTLTACFLSYMKKTHQDVIQSVTYLTTLVDFEEPGELGVFIDERQLESLDVLMARKGYFDGRLLTAAFNLLRPNDLIWPYFIQNYLKGEMPAPFDLLYWNCDSTHQPAAMYRFYLREFYLNNQLKQGEVKIHGQKVALEDIDIPIFYLSCINDHITPWQSTYRGANLMKGEKTFVLAGAGHVAGVINPPQKNKYSYWAHQPFCSNPTQWLEQALEHKGSWWPYWAKWLKDLAGQTIDPQAFQPQNPLCDAPGSYVKKQMI